jgi:hypothetical protein
MATSQSHASALQRMVSLQCEIAAPTPVGLSHLSLCISPRVRENHELQRIKKVMSVHMFHLPNQQVSFDTRKSKETNAHARNNKKTRRKQHRNKTQMRNMQSATT